MSEHAFSSPDRDNVRACRNEGCRIRIWEGAWQVSKGAKWKRTEPIPPCQGVPADAVGLESCAGETPAPSPLARVREAVEDLRMLRLARGEHTDKAEAALRDVEAAQRVLPASMQAFHDFKHSPGPHALLVWRDCPECRALLEARNAPR